MKPDTTHSLFLTLSAEDVSCKSNSVKWSYGDISRKEVNSSFTPYRGEGGAMIH